MNNANDHSNNQQIKIKLMDWDKKTQMVKLGNNPRECMSSMNEFHDFCINNVDDFDGQAWHMFINLIDLIPAEIDANIEFWGKIWPKIKDVDCNDPKFGTTSGFRIATLQTLLEDFFDEN